MRIVPVLDVMAGQTVRGIAGQRHLYRPWITPLAESSDPVAVARAFRDRFGLSEIYVADLDAIAGETPNWALYRSLHDDGFHLWVDAGIRGTDDVVLLRDAGIARIVVGLETLAYFDVLATVVADDVVFSLDMKNGEPLVSQDSPPAKPGGEGATTIARDAVALGVTKMLVLDLARVGVGQGTGTDELLANLGREFPGLELTAGGGVRDRGDLDRLARIGVGFVLVASALHDGRLSRTDIADFGS